MEHRTDESVVEEEVGIKRQLTRNVTQLKQTHSDGNWRWAIIVCARMISGRHKIPGCSTNDVDQQRAGEHWSGVVRRWNDDIAMKVLAQDWKAWKTLSSSAAELF